mmetsp:Transcript_6356/g.11326  ORF Transcript_6356/g.11326 Transcript_6356/m.11326 type:complete len:205 (+) Transcript_6356:123-737(+)|eukprot:CAMPEP_0183728798 /NCGR_PEP_ID=MMETSP0737-20130205/28939_1 /TAXON_ID=385413 /ORGANISM="Thalassiosira miniscula, Strain CCMP1093" /LENGTH=204 /DNA_ID=CAMNT_0025960825 /DNA_START=83 /DNA_END=697 /DNA_ORIENTATION=-
MTNVWTYLCIVAICGVRSQSFSPHALGFATVHHAGGSLRLQPVHQKQACARHMLLGDGQPEFTQDEMDAMEEVILSLSKESDDDKRREKLATILDEELEASANNDESDKAAFGAEIPRFAKLFQLSLDSVGERVQTAAREVAMEQQEQNANNGDGTHDDAGSEPVERVKSAEELQLWALIDMMVQSKTRVKLHMGSLGSKGEFR